VGVKFPDCTIVGLLKKSFNVCSTTVVAENKFLSIGTYSLFLEVTTSASVTFLVVPEICSVSPSVGSLTSA
jgi:hypothetical protein